MFFVPNAASDLELIDSDARGIPVSAEQQAQALDAFISEIDALSENRGGYMERNDDRTPFEHVVDLRFRQELFGAFFEDISSRAQKLELTVDIFNFTNFLNKD